MNNSRQIDKESPSEATDDEIASIRVGRLDTLESIRCEMAKLYRVARQNAGSRIDANTAAKLAYLLTSIGRSIEGTELEKRIKLLEQSLHKT